MCSVQVTHMLFSTLVWMVAVCGRGQVPAHGAAAALRFPGIFSHRCVEKLVLTVTVCETKTLWFFLFVC